MHRLACYCAKAFSLAATVKISALKGGVTNVFFKSIWDPVASLDLDKSPSGAEWSLFHVFLSGCCFLLCILSSVFCMSVTCVRVCVLEGLVGGVKARRARDKMM